MTDEPQFKFIEYAPKRGGDGGAYEMVQILSRSWTPSSRVRRVSVMYVCNLLNDLGLVEGEHFNTVGAGDGGILRRFRLVEFFDDESFILAKLMLS